MTPSTTLLVQPRLTVVTGQSDPELLRICEILEHKVMVDGRCDLEAAFGALLALTATQKPTPKTLDLVGHSVAETSVLKLGDWIIDTARSGVTAFFRELADHDVLPRLGVHAVRLLGSRTAETAHGRRTICKLSDILGLEVYGTTGIVFANHYNAQGFDDAWRFHLVASSDLRRSRTEPASMRGEAFARSFDLDALPATRIDTMQPWQVRISDAYTTRAILRLIRRNDGAVMPGLLALPRCEVVVPGSTPDTYHRMQLVLEGDFIRVYPDGANRPGVLYPVSDPHLLRMLVDRLPLFETPAYREHLMQMPLTY